MSGSVSILGVEIANVGYEEVIHQVGQWVLGSGPARHVMTVNPEFVVKACEDPAFFRILKEADLRVPDGVGLVLASKVLGGSLSATVTGVDLVDALCSHVIREGWSVFLLGGRGGVAQQAAEVLQCKYPGLHIGADSGSLHVTTETETEWNNTFEVLNKFDPDILLVGYGFPQQDFWISQHRDKLPCRVAIGVGGAFDMIAGRLPRAPKLWRCLGLEWFWRLLLQPSRLPRIYKATVKFPWLVLTNLLGL